MNDLSGAAGGDGVEVLIVGAGFSGLCAGIELDRAGIRDWLIVDKADGVGGTWWHNRYPGAACDVPSHFYSFSFEPNPDWTRHYSPQPEIRRYAEHCAGKYGLCDRMRLGREIESVRFDEASGRWRARFRDGSRIDARFVINGAGGLHRPAWPRIEGRDGFAGPAMHTAQWDDTVELAGRRVAVIGSAASAVQTVPELAKVARHVSVFQRTPNYIAPRKDAAYGEAERQRFRRFPWLMRLHRWIIFLRLELTLFPIVRNGWFRRRLARMVRGNIGKSVADPELRRRLEPAYELGCKRILISDDYYDALQRPNVDLVTDGIRRIEPDGVRDATGRLHAADVLIYATGFDLGGHMRSIEVAGRGGRRLAEDWGDLAEAYQGVMVAGYPNYFMTTGPNTGVGTTSIIFMIEQSVGWIVRVIRRARERDALVDVRPEAQRAYNDRIQADLQKTVWASGCHSWYRREDGKIETLYPYSGRAFRRQMARVRLSDLQFREVPQNVHA